MNTAYAEEELGEEDLAPANYPKGAHLLPDDFYWDCTDEFSPFGNDVGSDTFAYLKQWYREKPKGSPLVFLRDSLESWEAVDEGWDVVEPKLVLSLLDQNSLSFFTREEVIVATTFGWILVEGNLPPSLRKLCKRALQRQLLPEVMDRYCGQGHSTDRATKLQKMLAVLNHL